MYGEAWRSIMHLHDFVEVGMLVQENAHGLIGMVTKIEPGQNYDERGRITVLFGDRVRYYAYCSYAILLKEVKV